MPLANTTRNKARRQARWERRKLTMPKQGKIITARMIRRLRAHGLSKEAQAAPAINLNTQEAN